MSAAQRIAADNDPRNGSLVVRLLRMLEHPEMQPNEDGLYETAAVAHVKGDEKP